MLGVSECLTRADQRGELGAREMLEQLIKETGGLYDCLGPPVWVTFGENPAKE